MELGPKKKAELVERAEGAYRDAWDAFVGFPQPVATGERRGINAVVTLVLSECESRVAPLVEALEYCRPYTEKAGEAIRAYHASLADEPEPKDPEFDVDAARMMFGSIEQQVAPSARPSRASGRSGHDLPR